MEGQYKEITQIQFNITTIQNQQTLNFGSLSISHASDLAKLVQGIYSNGSSTIGKSNETILAHKSFGEIYLSQSIDNSLFKINNHEESEPNNKRSLCHRNVLGYVIRRLKDTALQNDKVIKANKQMFKKFREIIACSK